MRWGSERRGRELRIKVPEAPGPTPSHPFPLLRHRRRLARRVVTRRGRRRRRLRSTILVALRRQRQPRDGAAIRSRTPAAVGRTAGAFLTSNIRARPASGNSMERVARRQARLGKASRACEGAVRPGICASRPIGAPSARGCVSYRGARGVRRGWSAARWTSRGMVSATERARAQRAECVGHGSLRSWGLLGAWLVLGACGARDIGGSSEQRAPIAVSSVSTATSADPVAPAACARDEDCRAANRCVDTSCVAGACEFRARSCDDGDPCTEDTCDPDVGCQHRFLTEDLDGDGHRAPLAGMAAGAPGSCGDDCDDHSNVTYPGAPELCDGVDNDCNGVVDDGRALALQDEQPIWLSPNSTRAAVSGITHDGAQFVVAISAYRARNETELVGVGDGQVRWRSAAVQTNSDSYPGAIIATGQHLALAWEDRRDDDFEIYFNRFDTEGRKLGPDQRLSHARGFSLAPDLLFTGDGYFVAWADRRLGADDFRVFGQHVGSDGLPSSEQNVLLTPQTPGASGPRLARGVSTLGLLFHRTEVQGGQVLFQMLDEELKPLGAPRVLSGPHGVASALGYEGGRYYAFWYDYEVVPGDAIWGAILSEGGHLLMRERRLTTVAPFARHASVALLGKRWILAWSEYQDDRFGVHVQTFDQSLNPVGEVVALRHETGDLDGPQVAVSAQGEVAVAFTNRSGGEAQAYLVTLGCRDPG